MAKKTTSSSSEPTHRYSLRQRRSNAAATRTSDSDDDENAMPPAAVDTSATINSSEKNAGPLPLRAPSTPSSRAPGLSPRPEAFASGNMFRAAKGSDVENLLLFREQPRQLAVLALVVAAVSYFSFTHDSQVRACVCCAHPSTARDSRVSLVVRMRTGRGRERAQRPLHGRADLPRLLLPADPRRSHGAYSRHTHYSPRMRTHNCMRRVVWVY